MNDHDVLSDRLHALGGGAPVPVVDPLADVRRGRVALRRRHARATAGVTTALVAVGVTAVNLSPGEPGESGDRAVEPAGGVSARTSTGTSTSTSTGPVAGGPCTITANHAAVPPTQSPEITAALSAYHAAAAAILDPAGGHLDPAEIKRSQNVQTGTMCDPASGEERLTSLGTKIGWTSGAALGVVQLEVVSPQQAEQSQIAMSHAGWTAYNGHLPAGVRKARIVTSGQDGGGRAVIAKRDDGLTVAVDAEGVWGNNAAPGSPAAADLPSVGTLLALAADPRLTLPAG